LFGTEGRCNEVEVGEEEVVDAIVREKVTVGVLCFDRVMRRKGSLA
jgi:hypothetical protein